MFGLFALFGVIALAISAVCISSVDAQLSAEYEVNSRAIAQSIANSSMDIILNRDPSTLQSLIDQFKEIQGIKYIYITDEHGDMLAHTFVPGVPDEIAAADREMAATVTRSLAGIGDFIEVSSPILDGVVGSVHVGMDQGAVALKIRQAIGQQAFLLAIIFIVSVVATYVLVNLAAKPLVRLGGYASHVVAPDAYEAVTPADVEALLERDDEVGQIARVVRRLGIQPATEPEQS